VRRLIQFGLGTGVSGDDGLMEYAVGVQVRLGSGNASFTRKRMGRHSERFSEQKPGVEKGVKTMMR
jgi:hypothetical protein